VDDETYVTLFANDAIEAAMRHTWHFWIPTAALLLVRASAAASADDEAAYTRTITDRAEKIVAPLGIDDVAKRTRIREFVVNQYRGLRAIHDARDARLAQASTSPGDPAVAEAWRGVTQNEAELKLSRLHRRFVARLAAELTPEQVDKVKDGMTYGVVPITFARYCELLPELTVEQRAEIRANLLEAREYAMDAGSSEEKHAWFGKYKGRINNYLSAAGYNLNQAEKDWSARQKAASQTQ
jgi:hypothetical protein